MRMSSFQLRLDEFKDVLSEEVIDLNSLRKLSFNGCIEQDSIRPLTWKVLLNYLPCVRSLWSEELRKKRLEYDRFIDDLICSSASRDVPPEADHPLNPQPESSWKQYFSDNEMLTQIDKDCRRLCPDLSFFQQATKYPCLRLVDPALIGESQYETLRSRVISHALISERVCKDRSGVVSTVVTKSDSSDHLGYSLGDSQEAHWEVCERILFIFAKLNPGLGYVQGMNELLGPIYLTFATDREPACSASAEAGQEPVCQEPICQPSGARYAEADAFYCFVALMSEIRDNYIKTMDDSNSGIESQMKRFYELIKRKDSRVYLLLEEQEILPQHFAFRYLTLLLSQEFDLPDVQRLWDCFFADPHRFEFVLYVACAMVLSIRERIFQNDFSSNVKLLQNYPPTDPRKLLQLAVELRNSDKSSTSKSSTSKSSTSKSSTLQSATLKQ